MHFDELLTDQAILTELGSRIEQFRLRHGLTQAELADKAGVGRATVQRAEGGSSVQLISLIKLLRALDLLSSFDAGMAPPPASPIDELERLQRASRRSRQRAAGRRRGGGSGPSPKWQWGDPEPGQ